MNFRFIYIVWKKILTLKKKIKDLQDYNINMVYAMKCTMGKLSRNFH